MKNNQLHVLSENVAERIEVDPDAIVSAMCKLEKGIPTDANDTVKQARKIVKQRNKRLRDWKKKQFKRAVEDILEQRVGEMLNDDLEKSIRIYKTIKRMK